MGGGFILLGLRSAFFEDFDTVINIFSCYWFFIGSFIIMVPIIIPFKVHPDYQKMELYRLEGKIRFPGNTGWFIPGNTGLFSYAKPRPIINFHDCCKLMRCYDQYASFYDNIVGFKDGRKRFTHRVNFGKDGISFFFWYMDKNRPLPPDKSFDAHRQADFERRKAEGFPRPLYPSDVPTPEYTEEQQRERERIGGW